MTIYAITMDATGHVVSWGGEPLRAPVAGETAHTLTEADKTDQVVIDTAEPRYTKVVGGRFVAMDAAEKAVVVQQETAEVLKTQILPADYVDALTITCTATGLDINTVIEELGIDDDTSITADPTDTKYALVSLIYNETSDTFYVAVYEKTTGVYADLDADEYLVQQDIKEFSVVANGDTLVEV